MSVYLTIKGRSLEIFHLKVFDSDILCALCLVTSMLLGKLNIPKCNLNCHHAAL